jgi:Golgi apyrase
MAGSKEKGNVFYSKGIPYNYIVIIDAGSSGSRVHIYQYPSKELDNVEFPRVSKSGHKWSKKIHPGMSEFASAPKDVGKKHLKQLLKYAEEVVPKSQIPRTPIFVYATGGLRLLKQAESHKILTNACDYITKETDFFLPDCQSHLMVIDGQTEGLFGWLGLNYLIGGIEDPEAHHHGKNHSTYGFLDMGGASTQIAFVPNYTEIEENKSSLYRIALASLDGKHDQLYDVYSKSFLGMGVYEARKKYLTTLDAKEGSSVEDPCLPKGLKIDLDEKKNKSNEDDEDDDVDDDDDEDVDDDDDEDVDDNNDDKDGDVMSKQSANTLIGTGNYDQCAAGLVPLLGDISKNKGPDFDFEINHFVGVSEYWDTTDDGFQMGGSFDYEILTSKVRDFCGREWNSIRQNEFPGMSTANLELLCFKASWLLGVVDEGFGFPLEYNDTTIESGSTDISSYLNPLQSAEEINGVEFSWTLGPALLYASGELRGSSKSHNGIQINAASSAWNYGGEKPKYTRPVLTKISDEDDGEDWGDLLDEHSHRLWGSLLFLFILVVAVYLLLGKTRRRIIWESIKIRVSRLQATGGQYSSVDRRQPSPVAEDFELQEVEEDGFEVESDEEAGARV